eukprot:3457270-Prymnesium_polylepis.1
MTSCLDGTLASMTAPSAPSSRQTVAAPIEPSGREISCSLPSTMRRALPRPWISTCTDKPSTVTLQITLPTPQLSPEPTLRFRYGTPSICICWLKSPTRSVQSHVPARPERSGSGSVSPSPDTDGAELRQDTDGAQQRPLAGLLMRSGCTASEDRRDGTRGVSGEANVRSRRETAACTKPMPQRVV